MLVYKANYKSGGSVKYIDEIQNQMDYIEDYRNEMIKHGLG